MAPAKGTKKKPKKVTDLSPEALRAAINAVSPRFWNRVDKRGPRQPHMQTRCWVWTGAQFNTGYGEVHVVDTARVARVRMLAHRFSFQLHHQVVLSRQVLVCHHCDYRLCVRPSHLFTGGIFDNADDASSKGRLGKKLSMEQATEIRRLYQEGVRGKVLNALFPEVSYQTLWLIGSGQRWIHA